MALSLGGIEIVRPSNLQFQKQELHQAAVAHWYAREKERARSERAVPFEVRAWSGILFAAGTD
jgi:hypothetical protein